MRDTRRRLRTYRAKLSRFLLLRKEGKLLANFPPKTAAFRDSSATMHRSPFLAADIIFFFPDEWGIPESGFTVGRSSFSDLSQIMR